MRRENIMTSGGYYVATHILTVWKRLAGLEPDQPHGWSFPDVTSRNTVALGLCDQRIDEEYILIDQSKLRFKIYSQYIL